VNKVYLLQDESFDKFIYCKMDH